SAAGLFILAFMPTGVIIADEIVHTSPYVSSTFLNKNHFATFAGIGLVAATASVWRLYRRALHQTGDLLRLQLGSLIATTGGRAALPLALAFVILAALLLTGSRGGITVTTLGLFVLFILNIRSERRSGRVEVMLAGLAVVLIGAAFTVFGHFFITKIAGSGVYDQGR